MKSILIGITSAVLAVVAMAVPAAATFNLGSNTGTSSGYIGGNASMSSSGYSRVGFKDGKLIFEGETVTCFKGNFILGGMYTQNQNVNQTTPTLPSADTTDCNPTETVNDPPKNSTVTITGFCDDDAAKLKANINGTNVTVIVNSTGPCKDDDDTTTTTDDDDDDQVITVTPDAPKADNTSSTKDTSASDAASNPKAGGEASELPTTGAQEVITAIVATVLAAGTYGGVMAVRSRI